MLFIDKVSCFYQGTQVLWDITLSVSAKGITGIIGPNGSGKTTLLRAVSRLLKPKNGAIYLDGRDIWGMNLKETARKIAVVSQGAPADSFTVEEFILMGRIPYFEKYQFFETKHDYALTQECMELTGLIPFRDRLLCRLSGGERQLAMIARALAQEPELLLLDEPTTYLDIRHQVEILDLIKRLNRKTGLTVLMVLHDLNLASEYCDNIALLSAGKLYKHGKPEEVLTYKIVEEVYKTIVIVQNNPISQKPYMILVSGAQVKGEKNE
jgi:iron complex transport system ATP-binding protein